MHQYSSNIFCGVMWVHAWRIYNNTLVSNVGCLLMLGILLYVLYFFISFVGYSITMSSMAISAYTVVITLVSKVLLYMVQPAVFTLCGIVRPSIISSPMLSLRLCLVHVFVNLITWFILVFHLVCVHCYSVSCSMFSVCAPLGVYYLVFLGYLMSVSITIMLCMSIVMFSISVWCALITDISILHIIPELHIGHWFAIVVCCPNAFICILFVSLVISIIFIVPMSTVIFCLLTYGGCSIGNIRIQISRLWLLLLIVSCLV